MKIISKILFALSFLFVVACSEPTTKEDTSNDNSNVNTPPAEVVQPSSNVIDTSIKAVQDNSDVALNPPHGEPGHDCAIPVGAPLNSKGQQTSSPIQMNETGSSNSDASVADGLNPPHGQPGHDCALPVGAPLNQ